MHLYCTSFTHSSHSVYITMSQHERSFGLLCLDWMGLLQRWRRGEVSAGQRAASLLPGASHSFVSHLPQLLTLPCATFSPSVPVNDFCLTVLTPQSAPWQKIMCSFFERNWGENAWLRCLTWVTHRTGISLLFNHAGGATRPLQSIHTTQPCLRRGIYWTHSHSLAVLPCRGWVCRVHSAVASHQQKSQTLLSYWLGTSLAHACSHGGHIFELGPLRGDKHWWVHQVIMQFDRHAELKSQGT